MKLRALDLYAGGGGVSVGLARAGFDVTGVDLNPKCEKYWRAGMEPYGGEFICADALEADLLGFDLIAASPPCQRFSSLRHLQKGKEYPDLIGPTRERLIGSGAAWCIENVDGAPLGSSGFLILLCGTMFGLQTPDGRAELRRHRLFETSFSIPLRPACQHGQTPESQSVCGTGMGPGNGGKEAHMVARRQVLVATGHSYHAADGHSRRRAMSVTGNTAQTNVVRNQVRETFSIDDARHAMGIPWLPMKYLSQAIPPAYGTFIGEQARNFLASRSTSASR